MNKTLAPLRQRSLPNNITFPGALRDAIPDHKPSPGRCLKLDSVDAQAAHTIEWGRRVQIRLNVSETGKLTGDFDVWVDMELDAAKGLCEIIRNAAEHAAKLPPVQAFPTSGIRR